MEITERSMARWKFAVGLSQWYTRVVDTPESDYLVIDQAIRENRFGEKLIYVLCVLIVGAGIFAIIFGALKGEGLVALGGGIANALIYPPLREARQLRGQNMSIRLLEAPLRMANTSEEAARAIIKHFGRDPRGSN